MKGGYFTPTTLNSGISDTTKSLLQSTTSSLQQAVSKKDKVARFSKYSTRSHFLTMDTYSLFDSVFIKYLFLATYLPVLILLTVPCAILLFLLVISFSPLIGITLLPHLGHYVTQLLQLPLYSKIDSSGSASEGTHVPVGEDEGTVSVISNFTEGKQEVSSYLEMVSMTVHSFILKSYGRLKTEPFTLMLVLLLTPLISSMCIPLFFTIFGVLLVLLPFFCIFPICLIAALPLLGVLTLTAFSLCVYRTPKSEFHFLYNVIKVRTLELINYSKYLVACKSY